MKKIQNVFIINLEKRRDLWDYLVNVRNFFQQFGIKVTRIEGFDFITEIERNPLLFNQLIYNNRISLDGTGFHKTEKSMFGEIGAYLAHTKCWNKIVKEELEGTLIIEDGIIFHPENFSTEYDSNLDFTYLNKEMNTNLVGFGANAYILSNMGAKKLQKEMNTLYIPFDLQIRELCRKGILKYSIRPNYMFSRNNLPEFNKDRTSSICDTSTPLNSDHQNLDSILIRIIKGLIKAEIPVQQFIF